MKTAVFGATAAVLCATSVSAVGIDRSGQSVLSVFAPDGTSTVTLGFVLPDVSGDDIGGTGSYSNVGDTYPVVSTSVTKEVSDKVSFALIFDQPYGADITYDAPSATSNLGGTEADLNSAAISLVGRYKLGDRVSLFGGIKIERINAKVDLDGLAYANAISLAGVSSATGISTSTLQGALAGDPASVAAVGGVGAATTLGSQVATASTSFIAQDGYAFDMENTEQIGYLVGAAYEIPDIALRFAATYHFETEHSASATEFMPNVGTVRGEVDFVSPQSLNLDFQTGIAPGTLLIASYRWSDFSATELVPATLGEDLVASDDVERFTLGIGHQFSDTLSGSLTYLYEPESDLASTSALSLANGFQGLSIGGRYTDGGMTVSGGVNYTWLGDKDVDVGGTPVARFEDNTSLAIGFQADFKF